MPSPIQQAFLNLRERIDEDLVAALYERASLRTEDIIEELDARRLTREDPHSLERPDSQQLQQSTAAVIRQAGRRATVRGAVTGAAGLLAIPPEMMAAMIQILHLSQRLSVIWGHDPDTDRGRMLLVRSFATAFKLALPDQGQLGVRVRDLGRIAGRQVPDRRHTSLLVGLSLARHSLGRLGTGVARAIPGIGAIAGGFEARRVLHQAGIQMAPVYSRAWSGALRIEGPIEEAIEVDVPGLAAAPTPS
jgi:hypothetical protein